MKETEKVNSEAEKVIPRISPTHFTKWNSAKYLSLDIGSLISLFEFRDEWKVIGWAYSEYVEPRDLCEYVIFCERDGFQTWCHLSAVSFEAIAKKVRENPDRIKSLR